MLLTPHKKNINLLKYLLVLRKGFGKICRSIEQKKNKKKSTVNLIDQLSH